MPNAARVGDMIKQDSPHCHANIHPALPTATPAPHPAMPLAIVPPGSTTTKINKMAAARVSDQSAPCTLPACSPGGPGMISKGSTSVKVDNLFAARAGDMTAHSSCSAPIPGLTGTVQQPCSTSVKIGG